MKTSYTWRFHQGLISTLSVKTIPPSKIHWLIPSLNIKNTQLWRSCYDTFRTCIFVADDCNYLWNNGGSGLKYLGPWFFLGPAAHSYSMLPIIRSRRIIWPSGLCTVCRCLAALKQSSTKCLCSAAVYFVLTSSTSLSLRAQWAQVRVSRDSFKEYCLSSKQDALGREALNPPCPVKNG